MQEKAHFASEGFSVFSSAIGLMSKAKTLEKKAMAASGVSGDMKDLTPEQRMKMGMAASKDEETRSMEAKLMDEGIDTIWKLGKLMCEERLRKVVEMVLEPAKELGKKDRSNRNLCDELASAILLIGEEWEKVAEQAIKGKEFDLKTHITQSVAQGMDPDAPKNPLVTVRTKKFKSNPLLGRKQFVIDVLHPGQANVSKEAVTEKLAAMYKVKDAKQISVFQFGTVFGGGRSTGMGLIYSSLDYVKQFEPKFRLKRNGIETKAKFYIRIGRRNLKKMKGNVGKAPRGKAKTAKKKEAGFLK